MSLYLLNEKLKSCIVLDEQHVVSTDDGEVLNLEQFDALQMELADRVDGIGCYIKNLRAEAAACNAEAKVLTDRADIYLREASRCETYLSGVLYGQKFESPRCKITWRKSEACNVIDIKQVPNEYLRTKITVDANKTAIKNAIKAGVEVPGAELIQKLNMTLK